MGPNENPNNGITMIVEGNGNVSIVEENGHSESIPTGVYLTS